MSSNATSLREAELVPGAFPSEDAIMENEQPTHSSQHPTLTGTNTTDGDEKLAEKARDFAQQQHAAHTAGGGGGQQKTDQYIPASQNEGRSDEGGAARSHPGQNSEAWTDMSNPETLLRNADGAEAPTKAAAGGAGAHPAARQTPGAGQPAPEEAQAGVDVGAIGSSVATAATALGLAAKDALLATKDAAVPAASAATEQAKPWAGYAPDSAVNSGVSSTSASSRDTVPTGGVLETANGAAAYAKQTASSAAATAQSYAPHVLGEPAAARTGGSSGNIAAEVPRAVKQSVAQAGEAPEAAANAAAVRDKSAMERELLGGQSGQSEGHRHGQQEGTKPPSQAGSTGRVKGLSLEEQLMPESLTPGVAQVIGTEHARSFPLGAGGH